MAIIRTLRMAGALGAMLALAACGGQVPAPQISAATVAPAAPGPNAASVVSMVQLAYAGVKADLALGVPANSKLGASLAKLDATVGPEVAALSSASAPTTIQAALADLKLFASQLPPTAISPTHLFEIEIGLSAAQLLAGPAPQPAAAPPTPPPMVNLGGALTTPATAPGMELVP